LSDLLQAPIFQDICNVELRERGYVVIPKARPVTEHNGAAALSRDCPPSPLHDTTMTVSQHDLAQSSERTLAADDEKTMTRENVPQITLLLAERLQFCTDEPLCDDDVPVAATPTGPTFLATPSPWIETNAQYHSSSAVAQGGMSVISSPRHVQISSRITFCPKEPLDVDPDEVEAIEAHGSELGIVQTPTLLFPVCTPSPWPLQSFSNHRASRITFCPEEPLDVNPDEVEANEAHDSQLSVVPTPKLPFPTCTPSPSPWQSCSSHMARQRSVIIQIACHV